ncbi:hypothetical protein GPECTOR_37g229 [Gonium pectorale]|uniref:Uncharacterized protein n=1 Tax=Gonium pectorale TaxID=33097 RepID=A0A150GBS8_GONPE|nr:hypothetical protein GPECTOR_37g229 [Gonium pectorale]|eukprot:KXZ47223.1 hypothetical protein GPECTOR_37g229 [Gonium pectorale]
MDDLGTKSHSVLKGMEAAQPAAAAHRYGTRLKGQELASSSASGSTFTSAPTSTPADVGAASKPVHWNAPWEMDFRLSYGIGKGGRNHDAGLRFSVLLEDEAYPVVKSVSRCSQDLLEGCKNTPLFMALPALGSMVLALEIESLVSKLEQEVGTEDGPAQALAAVLYLGVLKLGGGRRVAQMSASLLVPEKAAVGLTQGLLRLLMWHVEREEGEQAGEEPVNLLTKILQCADRVIVVQRNGTACWEEVKSGKA